MPKRQITDEELRTYLITGEKPKDATAVAALKDYFGVSDVEAPLPDATMMEPQFPEAKVPELSQKEDMSSSPIDSSEKADKRIMSDETAAPQNNAERLKAINQIGLTISPEKFKDDFAFKKPALFDKPYLGLPTKEADEMIMAGQLPERLVAEPPEPIDVPHAQAQAQERLVAEPPEPIDVPHAQAQAQAQEEHVDIPKEGHTNDLLKITDNQKKEEKIADEKLAQTNPVDYIKKKYGLDELVGLDELKAAQKQANWKRALARAGESFMRAGYGFKNLEMPESEAKYYAKLQEEANQPVEQAKQRQAQALLDLQITKTGADLIEDMEDKEAKDDSNSLISQVYRMAAEKVGIKVPPNTPASTLEKVLPTLKDLVKKEAKNYRFEKLVDDDGVIRTYAIPTDDPTQKIPVGEAGFATQFRTTEEGIRALRPSQPGGEAQLAVSSKRKPVEQMTEQEIKNFVPDKGQRQAMDDRIKSVEKVTKNVREQLQAIDRVKKMLKNPTAFEASYIKTQMPRVASEVGNLNTTEQAAWATAQDLLTQISQKLTEWGTSKLTQRNAEELMKTVILFEKSAKAAGDAIAKGSADYLESVHSIPKSFSTSLLKNIAVPQLTKATKAIPAGALEWLKAHPDDPRAPAIKKKLGIE